MEEEVVVEVDVTVVVVKVVDVVVVTDVLVDVVVVTLVVVVVLVQVLVVDVCRIFTVSVKVVVKFPYVGLLCDAAAVDVFEAVLFVVVVVAAVVKVVAELVVVLAEEIQPTVVVVEGPEGMMIFPILFPTSSVKNTLIVPL